MALIFANGNDRIRTLSMGQECGILLLELYGEGVSGVESYVNKKRKMRINAGRAGRK